MGLVQSVLQTAWFEFFKVFGFICSSGFVSKSTPILVVLFLLYRIFGPVYQSDTFLQSKVPHLEQRELVNTEGNGNGNNNNRGIGRIYQSSAKPTDTKKNN